MNDVYIFIFKLYCLSFLVEQKLHCWVFFLLSCALESQCGYSFKDQGNAVGLTLHGFYFSAEDITGTHPMAGQIKTSTTSRTCKCSEFPRAGADSEESAQSNSEKWRG